MKRIVTRRRVPEGLRGFGWMAAVALSIAVLLPGGPVGTAAARGDAAARPTATPARRNKAQPAATPRPTATAVLPVSRIVPPITASLVVTINVDSTFARVAPDWNAGLVGRLMKWDRFTAVGRNADAEWLQIDYGNSLVWIHQTMARYPRDLEGVRNPLVQALSVNEKAGNLSPSRVVLSPAGAPGIPARARQIYQAAVASGRDPFLFTVAGDCNSELPVYLGRFAVGGLDLAAVGFGNLQATAGKWGRSFARASLAVDGGHNAASVMDPLFNRSDQCHADEGPLACELRVSNASVVFIGLGTGDTFTWNDFPANYRRIIDTAIQYKVLPVLVTKADSLESTQGGAPQGAINDAIRALGNEYQVPVMDFALAARGLPGQGLLDEAREIPGQGVVYNPNERFHLNGYGMDMRMVLTLMTLNAIGAR